jgi:hypothetical protein
MISQDVVNVPPLGSSFRIINDGTYRAINDGKRRVTNQQLLLLKNTKRKKNV